MKKIIYAMLLVSATLGAASCKNDPKLPTPSVEEFPQIFTNITAQSVYKLADARGSGNPTAIVNLDVRGGDASKVEAIEIYRTARTYNVPAVTTPPTNPVLGQGGNTVLLRSVPPVSGDIEISINDLIAGMTRPTGASQTGTRTAITRASLQANEGFLLTYALLLKGGRRIEYLNSTYSATPYSGVLSIVP